MVEAPCARWPPCTIQGRQRLLAAALMLVSAGMAAAYGPMGVRVNAVNPGATHTERLRSGMQATARMLHFSLAQATRKALGAGAPRSGGRGAVPGIRARQLRDGWCSPWMARPRPWWFDAVGPGLSPRPGPGWHCGIIPMLLAAPGAHAFPVNVVAAVHAVEHTGQHKHQV